MFPWMRIHLLTMDFCILASRRCLSIGQPRSWAQSPGSWFLCLMNDRSSLCLSNPFLPSSQGFWRLQALDIPHFIHGNCTLPLRYQTIRLLIGTLHSAVIHSWKRSLCFFPCSLCLSVCFLLPGCDLAGTSSCLLQLTPPLLPPTTSHHG